MILISVCLVSNSFADAVPVKKGEIAPFEGILISKEDAVEFRNAMIDRDRYKLTSESLQRSLDLQGANVLLMEKRVELYKNSSDELSKKLYEASSMSSWERVGIFVLGVAATVGAGFAITKASR